MIATIAPLDLAMGVAVVFFLALAVVCAWPRGDE